MLHPTLLDNVVEGGSLAVALVLVVRALRRPRPPHPPRRDDES